MSSHTFHELEKWHKSIIHRYGYMVMPHMSHKMKDYCAELDFFIESAKEKMSMTMDTSRKSDIRIMIEHIGHVKKHAEPMCGESTTKKEETTLEEDTTSVMSTIKGFFGTNEKEETGSLKEEPVSKRKRAMSQYNIFVKERYEDVKKENPGKSIPEIMKLISEEWNSKKDTYKPSKVSSEEETELIEEESEEETESLKEEETEEETESLKDEESEEESEEETESLKEEESEERDIEKELTAEEIISKMTKTEKKVYDGGSNSWKEKLSRFYL
jgi:chemotaxis protein histidine kinase CheA